jgi:hypothetical protein
MGFEVNAVSSGQGLTEVLKRFSRRQPITAISKPPTKLSAASDIAVSNQNFSGTRRISASDTLKV